MRVLDLEVEGTHEFIAAGVVVHNCEIEYFKRDDFQLWVTDGEGNPAAVVPMGPAGSGDQRVMVIFSTPGTALYAEHAEAQRKGAALVLPPAHPIARMALAPQSARQERGGAR